MDIRIADDARAAAIGTVDTAFREGRLDLAEYERRLMVIQIAKVLDDLTPAITDLPGHQGQREPGLRISAAEREQALVLLAGALTDGRIEAAEYTVAEARLRRAVRYADLDAIVGDLAAEASLVERDQAIENVELAVTEVVKALEVLTPASTDPPGTRISAAEREQALVRLAEALTDGRIEAAEYTVAEDRLQRAVTYADMDEIIGDLDAKASLVERVQAIDSIEAAVADGLLDPAERHGRVEAARNATSDAQLAALVADLSADTRSPDAPVRASDEEREAAAARLHDAVKAGTLDLAQFDERVRAVYAARLSSELTRLLADLPKPAPPPEPPPVQPSPAQPPATVSPSRWRPNSGLVITLHCVVGLALFGGISLGMAELGLAGLAVWPLGVWLIILVWLVRFSRLPVATDPAVEPGSPVQQLSELSGHQRPVTALTCLVLPDGTPVAISGAQDNTAMVWDLATNSHRHTLSGHTNDVVDVAATVLPDGVPIAVTVSADRTIRMWDLRDGSQRGAVPGLRGEPRLASCFTLADGTPALLSLSSDAVQLLDLRDFTELGSGEVLFAADAIVPMVLPGGEPVAVVVPTNVDRNLHIVNMENGKGCQLRGHTELLTAVDVAVLPDGTPVAVSAGLDKTIRIWDLVRRKRRRVIANMIYARQAVLCSSLPDGTPVVVGAVLEDHTRVWNLRNGRERDTIALRGGPLAAVALPDRTLLVGTISDGSVVGVYPLR